jgi:hypothetical protein
MRTLEELTIAELELLLLVAAHGPHLAHRASRRLAELEAAEQGKTRLHELHKRRTAKAKA